MNHIYGKLVKDTFIKTKRAFQFQKGLGVVCVITLPSESSIDMQGHGFQSTLVQDVIQN